MSQFLDAFLLALPALYSIVNPLGIVFIFREVTASRSPAARAKLVLRVAINCLLVMLVALWAGSYVLAFFGISLGALRIAGGLIVTYAAWELLHQPESREARKQGQVVEATDPERQQDIAMFPLTIPLTTGPGAISVCVALGAQHPRAWPDQYLFFGGVSLAALAMAVVIWATYRAADPLSNLLGPSGSRTATRLGAFVMVCIGVQIFINGVTESFGLAGH